MLFRAPLILKCTPAKVPIKNELILIIVWSQPLLITIIFSSEVMVQLPLCSTLRLKTFVLVFSGEPCHLE